MDATEYAELAATQANRALALSVVDEDTGYAERMLVTAQVQAMAALAAAVDRLAAAAEAIAAQ